MSNLPPPNQVDQAYKAVFNTPQGMTVLYDLCQRGFLFRSLFDHDSTMEMCRNEGARELVLSILKKAKVTPHQIIQDYEQFYRKNPI